MDGKEELMEERKRKIKEKRCRSAVRRGWKWGKSTKRWGTLRETDGWRERWGQGKKKGSEGWCTGRITREEWKDPFWEKKIRWKMEKCSRGREKLGPNRSTGWVMGQSSSACLCVFLRVYPYLCVNVSNFPSLHSCFPLQRLSKSHGRAEQHINSFHPN